MDKSLVWIIMEYCSRGDIAATIKKAKDNNDRISEEVVWKVLYQIVLALNDCHHHRSGTIIHRDLKPGNIFIGEDNKIKLGDFGLSKAMSADDQYTQTHVGTPYYMSPE